MRVRVREKTKLSVKKKDSKVSYSQIIVSFRIFLKTNIKNSICHGTKNVISRSIFLTRSQV